MLFYGIYIHFQFLILAQDVLIAHFQLAIFLQSSMLVKIIIHSSIEAISKKKLQNFFKIFFTILSLII